ncbi:MAG: Stk1 family PASTA domain-containing Ser/Thr kinase [Corynebacteriales bacterium]|nr:Stk1 family PASTA domain-containing Ser/Thr kinase [Mycobacteriales bacterium]
MDTTLTDPLLSVVLDQRYRVTGRIATGGMAAVYEAQDERLERTVAVKVMHQSYAEDASFVARFITEAKSAAALNHPCVVSVFDQGTDNGYTYLVMEKVDGHTLRDVLGTRGRLDAAEAVSITESVLEALTVAHRNKLVHRDVKPENVLISADGLVKVADFGLARAMEGAKRHTANGVVMGTVTYVSPEQILSGDADPRSDIYAVGIMLYEMLTGAPPFTSQSAVNVAFQHVHSDIPSPRKTVPDLADALSELVVSATRREPDQRPADAGIMLARLRALRDQLGLRTVTVSGMGSSPRPPIPSMRPNPTSTQVMRPKDDGPTQLIPAIRDTKPDADATALLPAIPQHYSGAVPRSSHRAERDKRWWVIPAIIVSLLLVAGLVGWWWGSAGTTITPGVVGVTKAEAERRADKVGLTVKYTSAEYSQTVKKDHVISQKPEANEEIEEGGTITVVLSKGPERLTVPKVAGLEEKEAIAKLNDAELKYTITRDNDPAVPKGTVIRTEPGEGEKISRGGSVSLVISKGEKNVVVPNVVGLPASQAKTQLEAEGYVVTIAGDPAGTVTAQNPPAGTSVAPGSTVAVTAQSQLIVPDVTGMKYDEAKKHLEGMGLRVDKGVGSKRGTVLLQTPGPGTPVRPGDKVTLHLSLDD